jgi:GDP/UDP-N,N'-diacetylbacillosamine 2-epimerase (hydrolysing)
MKICVITSTRADFGLLKNLIFELKNNKFFSVKTIASGTHFSKKYGYTYKEIKESKIKIDEKIFCKFNLTTPKEISQVISKCITQSSKIYKKLQPDLLVVLGDRYEVLASALSAHICRIPIAHIHGGEVTRGVLDDAFRHSITKMAQIHFVANTIYKKRVMQLGENPKNVHVVGGLGIDSISKTNLIKKSELERKFKFKFNKKNLLINFHPETLSNNIAKIQINELLLALPKSKDISLFFTMPGADVDNEVIIKRIKKFTLINKNAFFFKSLGHINYFSFLKNIDGMVGNSSSGLLEMPYFKKGTINIGNRQTGRLIAKSVINVKIKKKKYSLCNKKNIIKKFSKKHKKQHQSLWKTWGNPKNH